MDWTIIASGFVGAAAPEIVRLYRLRAQQLPKVHRGYVLISVAFFLLGAFAAWIFQAASTYAAFYIGASTDALISSMAGKPPTVTPPPAPSTTKGPVTFALPMRRYLSVREYLGALTGSAK